MASTGVGSLDPEPLLRLVRSAPMLNKILASICKAEGLPATGVKIDLQSRISDNIKRYAAVGDAAGFERVKAMLEHPERIQQLQMGPSHRFMPHGQFPSTPSPHGMANNYNGTHPILYRGGGINVHFKPSPFYTIQQQLGETKLCDIMAHHRHTVTIQVKPMDYPILSSVQTDKSLRVMVFSCEADQVQPKHDILFPYQSEIKVNGGEIKANLRGLKNKPGSTRPVDITDALRLRQIGYANNIEMTYALTNKEGVPIQVSYLAFPSLFIHYFMTENQKFYLMIFVVKSVQVPELVKQLERGKKISRESVVRDMINKARDPDIVATSTVLSLKCPLSYSRIALPCRSISCRHNQCFDATSYLQLQEQGPTWLCPICNIPAPFDSLAVDEYVRDILSKTNRSVEQVTIEPEGTWSQNIKSESPNDKPASFGSDDEDFVEIKDSRVSALKMASTPVPSNSSMRTPPIPSREASASVGSRYPPTSSKRPISQVIDLTLSDDDDEPLRPPKRQFTGYSTPQSMSAGRNGQSSS